MKTNSLNATGFPPCDEGDRTAAEQPAGLSMSDVKPPNKLSRGRKAPALFWDTLYTD